MMVVALVCVCDQVPPIPEKTYTIRVEPGWKEGTKVKFETKGAPAAEQQQQPQEGEEGEKQSKQNVVEFVVAMEKHPIFTRRGDDIFMEHHIR